MASNVGRKVLGYVGSLVFGSVVERAGRKRAQTIDVTQQPQYKTTKGKQAGQKMQQSMQKPFDDSYFHSFNPMFWQVPHFQMDMFKTMQYMATTTRQQKKEDMSQAMQDSAKKAMQEMMQDPLANVRKAFDKSVQAKQVYDASQQDGDMLEQHAHDFQQLKTGQMMQSVGRNMMFKAPGYLMPGPMGFMYRSFFTAKAIGNASVQYNQLAEMNKQAPSTFKAQRDKRLQSAKQTGTDSDN